LHVLEVAEIKKKGFVPKDKTGRCM
jgi:hypothetical protein